MLESRLVSRPLEFILARQWSELLSVPVLLFDADLRLVFFNDAAGLYLGRSFNETGSMDPQEWRAAFPMTDATPEGSPLAIAQETGVPAQADLTLESLAGRRRVRVTAWPIDGLTGSRVGLLATLHPTTT